MEDLLAVLGRQGFDLAQPVPQAGIGAAGRGLDGAVADQFVEQPAALLAAKEEAAPPPA